MVAENVCGAGCEAFGVPLIFLTACQGIRGIAKAISSLPSGVLCGRTHWAIIT
jgi:hypothetical protein